MLFRSNKISAMEMPSDPTYIQEEDVRLEHLKNIMSNMSPENLERILENSVIRVTRGNSSPTSLITIFKDFVKDVIVNVNGQDVRLTVSFLLKNGYRCFDGENWSDCDTNTKRTIDALEIKSNNSKMAIIKRASASRFNYYLEMSIFGKTYIVEKDKSLPSNIELKTTITINNRGRRKSKIVNLTDKAVSEKNIGTGINANKQNEWNLFYERSQNPNDNSWRVKLKFGNSFLVYGDND